jgi:hypothetical protein
MKNFTDTIGNRIRELTACNTVPQPTAPPRTAMCFGYKRILDKTQQSCVTSGFRNGPNDIFAILSRYVSVGW